MSRIATVTELGPRLSPSTNRVPERRSVSLERRFDVSGAPLVSDRLRTGDFEPIDALFWVSMDVGSNEGRWSVYLWGTDQRLRQSTQFDGPVRLGGIETHTPPPAWVRSQLNMMLAEVKADARRLLKD